MSAVDFTDPRQRAAAADAVAARLHMTTGICRDRSQAMARELLDVAQAAASSAVSTQE